MKHLNKILLFLICSMLCITITGCKKKYTIDFVSNCDTKIESQLIKKGEKVLEPQTITKKGYTFDGWYYNGEKCDIILIDNILSKNTKIDIK